MSSLTRLGLLHGNGALPWIGMPIPTFDVGERVLLNAGEPQEVTVASQLSRHRYVVRWDSGAEIIAQATMLEAIR